MFEARNVVFEELEPAHSMHGASADGRGFAVSGGVASAVVNCVHDLYPDREVKTAGANGLEECRKLLALAKAEHRRKVGPEGYRPPIPEGIRPQAMESIHGARH